MRAIFPFFLSLDEAFSIGGKKTKNKKSGKRWIGELLSVKKKAFV